MPRTRSLAFSELKIGVLAVVALAIAAGTIFLLSGQGGFFWQQYHLKARFKDAVGLKAGAPVRVAGMEVGSVDDMAFVGADIEVVLKLNNAMRPRVTTDSVAAIGSLSLLGQSVVDITASTAGRPLGNWEYLRSAPPAVALAEVAAKATSGLAEATALFHDVRSGRGTMGKLFTDEELYQNLQRFVAAAEDATRNLNRGRGTLGRLMQDPAAYRALEASLKNLETMTSRLNAGEGSLGRLIHDDAFARSLAATTSNFETMSGRLNRGEGTIGKLMTDEALYKRFDSVANRLDALIAQINEGGGTVGQLMRDKQLYENMNAAASELRNLVGDIRKDPRKYLNVKVSLF
ncbi:MAG: MCE family protein [Acidobacteria bacterium]|nr:MCE family protein [Acidobacteriota bacterium]MBI3263022.1 MCE family protein [Acidobacteriota bacterium]